MKTEIMIDGVALPQPDGDLDIRMEQVEDSHVTEAGGTVIIRRSEKLYLSATFTLTGRWVSRFRSWQSEDTVTVRCFYPDPGTMSSYTCYLRMKEQYKHESRQAQGTNGLYTVSVTIREF